MGDDLVVRPAVAAGDVQQARAAAPVVEQVAPPAAGFGLDVAAGSGAKAGKVPAGTAATSALCDHPPTPGKFTFRIAHTNDTHSALDMAPRMKTAMAEAVKADPHILKVHAGDLMVGTPWYEVGGKGVADMQVLENLGFDAFVVGNHDLDSGVANLANALKHTKVDVVVANWDVTGPLAERIKPYTVKEIDDHKVAVIGLSVDPAAYGNATPDITYHDPVETLRKLLPELKGKVDAIVVASHIGAEEEEALAGYFPEINVIIGGHSHTVINVPQRVTHPDMSQSLVTQAGSSNRFLGLMEIDMADGKVASKTGSLLSLDEKIPPHAEMVELLKPYAEKMAPYQEKIAVASAAISNRPSGDSADSHLGNLVTDVLRARATAYLQAQGDKDAKADIAIFNDTGLRAPIPKGPVTIGTMYNVFPFDNTLAMVELTGAQIQEMLDHAASRGGDAISGVTYGIDRMKAVDIKVGGQPLEPQRTYRVVTNNFIVFKGGSGYKVMAEGKNPVDTGLSIRTMLTEHFRQAGTVSVPREVEPRATLRAGQTLGEIVRKKLGISEAEGCHAGH